MSRVVVSKFEELDLIKSLLAKNLSSCNEQMKQSFDNIEDAREIIKDYDLTANLLGRFQTNNKPTGVTNE